MSRHTFAVMIAVIASSLSVSASAHAELPKTLRIGKTDLVLNGAGTRSKYLMQMYVAGLYLAEPSKDAAAIAAADEPMALRLQISSAMVTQEKLAESLDEGFRNSTKGKVEPIQKELDHFRRILATKIAKGDVIDLAYFPEHGTVVAKNGKSLGVVSGLAFKKALIGIWLGDKPADATLKRDLLAANVARQ